MRNFDQVGGHVPVTVVTNTKPEITKAKQVLTSPNRSQLPLKPNRLTKKLFSVNNSFSYNTDQDIDCFNYSVNSAKGQMVTSLLI